MQRTENSHDEISSMFSSTTMVSYWCSFAGNETKTLLNCMIASILRSPMLGEDKLQVQLLVEMIQRRKFNRILSPSFQA
jgi:hypothetical protein